MRLLPEKIGVLCLQLVTRILVKMAAEELIPVQELPESLIELIRMLKSKIRTASGYPGKRSTHVGGRSCYDDGN